jgi:sulfate-transporting ATPase
MKHELEWVRSNPKGRQAKSKARLARFEELQSAGFPEAQRDQRDLHPAGRAPRRPGDRGQGPAQGLRRPAAVRGPLVQPAQGRHRRHHRPQRRRQDHPVPHHHRPGAARTPASCASARRCRSPMSTRAATRSTTAKTVWEEISGGAEIIIVGNFEMPSRAYARRFNFRGSDQQKRSATCPAVSATACTWPSC